MVISLCIFYLLSVFCIFEFCIFAFLLVFFCILVLLGSMNAIWFPHFCHCVPSRVFWEKSTTCALGRHHLFQPSLNQWEASKTDQSHASVSAPTYCYIPSSLCVLSLLRKNPMSSVLFDLMWLGDMVQCACSFYVPMHGVHCTDVIIFGRDTRKLPTFAPNLDPWVFMSNVP